MVPPMSKPYTAEEFSAQVVEDRNWRMKEISDLKNAIKRGDAGLKKVLLRALVAICYAHWEGFVKFSAKKYLDHIALRKAPYRELSQQFYRNYFLPRLAALGNTKASLADRCTLIDEILNSGDQRFSRTNEDLINTRSNLNSDVLADICLVCEIPPSEFEDHSTFIDVFLLKRRNSIAHGEATLIDVAELDELTESTISLMRVFGDALENQVILQSYKASPENTLDSHSSNNFSAVR
jgi:hypothetical protein